MTLQGPDMGSDHTTSKERYKTTTFTSLNSMHPLIMKIVLAVTVFRLCCCPLLRSSAQQCGNQAGGALCANGHCCSQYGYCGITDPYCGKGCQSNCPSSVGVCGGGGGGSGVASIVNSSLFDQMLLHRNDASCPAHGFYTYNAFIAAANSFTGFGTTGDINVQKREIAAFFAQTSHETSGAALAGPYSWGYCYVRERVNPGALCQPSNQWPCAKGKEYYGRGPIQISYNYNYGPCGQAIGSDLLNNPDLVASDPTISFKSALWFWMTPHSREPSCHAVAAGQWTPSADDQSAMRLPGFGVITNIISGGSECGNGSNPSVQDRIGFYKRYCDILDVNYGPNVDCGSQSPF